jgi:ribonuclease T2
MKKAVTWGLLCFVISAAPLVAARRHHRHHHPARFDYYVLALSWAPNYCASHPSDHSSECQVGGHKAFVLHGLWPQANNAAPPMSCAPASPVAHSIVDHMLQLMPTRALIEHEWAKHGTCSGLSAQDYFGKVEQAFRKVQVPSELQSLNSPKDFGTKNLEQNFASTNHAPEQAFRVSCHSGDLVSVEVCLDKNLDYQSCTGSVHECTAGQVRVRPPK